VIWTFNELVMNIWTVFKYLIQLFMAAAAVNVFLLAARA